MLSESVQNYLKTIYELHEDNERVTTTALAEHLQIAPASVTGMIKKLAEMKLVEHEPYQGVLLTETGAKMALEIIRHHRLIELYLTEALGYSWDRVHEEAERLEHAISEELEDRMATMLGDPKNDPHGDPIPARDGTIADYSRATLANAQIGAHVRIDRVRDEDAGLLRRLGALGLKPNVQVKITGEQGAKLMFEIEGKSQSISHADATHIFVRGT